MLGLYNKHVGFFSDSNTKLLIHAFNPAVPAQHTEMRVLIAVEVLFFFLLFSRLTCGTGVIVSPVLGGVMMMPT